MKAVSGARRSLHWGYLCDRGFQPYGAVDAASKPEWSCSPELFAGASPGCASWRPNNRRGLSAILKL